MYICEKVMESVNGKERANYEWIDNSIHKWSKQQEKEKRFGKIENKTGARKDTYTAITAPGVDKRRTNILTQKGMEVHHRAQRTIRRLRLHGIATVDKLHKQGKNKKQSAPMKWYYQTLYPDEKCHFCLKHTTNTEQIEDTAHSIMCPIHRREKAKLWKKIHDKIRRAQTAPTAYQLYPFSMGTRRVREKEEETRRRMKDVEMKLGKENEKIAEQINEENDWMGIVPDNLEEALRELNVKEEKVNKLADWIAVEIHLATARIYRKGRETIMKEREQKLRHKTLVWGRWKPLVTDEDGWIT